MTFTSAKPKLWVMQVSILLARLTSLCKQPTFLSMSAFKRPLAWPHISQNKKCTNGPKQGNYSWWKSIALVGPRLLRHLVYEFIGKEERNVYWYWTSSKYPNMHYVNVVLAVANHSTNGRQPARGKWILVSWMGLSEVYINKTATMVLSQNRPRSAVYWRFLLSLNKSKCWDKWASLSYAPKVSNRMPQLQVHLLINMLLTGGLTHYQTHR